MKIYNLRKDQFLPITIEQAWTFFSSAKNLAKITPPEMGFVILSELSDAPITSGMTIDYTVTPLFNIPMKWTTGIAAVNAPFVFTDTQLKGPYSLWEHTHRFSSIAGGVKMTDEVKYALPFGWLGQLVHKAVVKNKLDEIFNFREQTLNQLFGKFNK